MHLTLLWVRYEFVLELVHWILWEVMVSSHLLSDVDSSNNRKFSSMNMVLCYPYLRRESKLSTH